MNEPLATTELLPWSLEQIQNVGHTLTETAIRMPGRLAVACPAYQKKGQRFERISFAELEARSNQIALGLLRQGIQKGSRLALMVPPGIDFVAFVFGMFKAGVVVILIDPGMGRKNMIRCLAESKPAGMVGIPAAHVVRNLFRSKFPSCKSNISLGWFPGCLNSVTFQNLDPQEFQPVEIERENEAAIIFTTGSTGPPKGVLYRHRIFIEQARQVRDYFDIRPGTTDVSGFPLFALFNAAMGATTIFPRMDATRPARIHPPDLIEAVNEFQADQSFGSPALWNTVSKYCLQNSVRLPGIKRVLTAGAPVPPELLARIRQIIHPDGEVFTPYGATESLPIACNSATVVLGETAEKTKTGAGTCVGNRFPDMTWKLIKITDEPILNLRDCEFPARGEIGELIVQGAVVTDRYVTRVDANRDHKIIDGDAFWHRMGDVGYFDEQERFWFCGRKSHRVTTEFGTMFTIPCEGIINTHPSIYRSALVGVGVGGQQTPVIVAEPYPEKWPTNKSQQAGLVDQLQAIAIAHWQTDRIEHFLLHRSLPVDIRHNSKIFREQLRDWARRRI